MPNKSLLKRAKTDSYTSKPMKVSTQWLKNATRSLGGSALDSLQEIAPNIYSVAETSAKLAKQVTKSGNADAIGQKISSNRYVSMGRNAIKNALKDLQQGNLAGSEKDGSSSDDESTRYNFGDNGGEDEGASQSPIFVNVDGMDQVSNAITTQTKYQQKADLAKIDTMVATSSAMMAANQKHAEATINVLTNIDNSLQSLVKYQNENMTKFIQASLSYYESMGKANTFQGGGDREINTSDVFDKNGKFSVDKYGELLKKNVQDAIKESDIGLLGTMLDSFGDDLEKNPLKYITKAVMDKAIPGAIKAATESVDKHFGNFIGEYIMKQSEILKGKDNFLAKFFGKALDLNIDRKEKFELGGKVTADAAVFDGITRNAITAEIPKYLRESTSYLRQLVELSGGDPDKAVGKSNIFNRETGMFEKYEDYTKTLLESINQSVLKTFEDSDFGKSMRKVADADELGSRKDEFSKLLEQFYLALEQDERQRIDITKKGSGSDINSIIKGLSGSDDVKRILENAVYSSFDNKKGGMNINISRMAAKNARNEQIGYLEKNRTMDLAEAIGTETSVDKASARVDESSSKSHAMISPLTRLQRIEELLQRGINVRVTGQKAYKKMKFNDNGSSSGSTDATQTSSNEQSRSQQSSSSNFDFNEIMSRGEDTPEATGEKSKFFVKGAESLKEAMNAIIRGDKEGFSNSMKGLFGSGAGALWNKIKGSDAAKSVSELFHGKKDENGETTEKGLIDKVKDQFKTGLTSVSKAIFGEEGDIDKLKEEAIKKAKEVAPGALKGAAIGIGAGGILGTLVGGPLTGAVLGVAGHFMTKSETFQHILYGDLVDEVDEEGNPTGNKVRDFSGIIDKQTSEFMKKNKGILTAGGVGGAAIGAMTGGGILGSLVGGPIAGAFLGTAATAIVKSNAFQKFVFGEETTDENGNKKKVGGIMNMFRSAFKNLDKDRNPMAEAGGGMAAGAGLGLLASFFTPIGPVGGAAAGLAISMVHSKDKFKELLFGKKDKDGNKVSKGLIETLGTRMQKEVIAPLAGIAGEALMSAKDAVMDHILDPIMNLAEPLIGLTARIYDKVTEKLDNLMDSVKGGIKKIIGKGFGLLGKGIGFLFKKVFGDKESGIIGGAMKIGGGITNFVGDKIRKGNEKASRKKFFGKEFQSSQAGKDAMSQAQEQWNGMSDEQKAKFGGKFDNFVTDFGRKYFYNAGDGRLEREEASKKRKETRAERKQTARDSINREKIISELTGGQYGAATNEARQAALEKLKTTKAYRHGRSKYGGMKIEEIERLLQPEENTNATADDTLLEETRSQTTALEVGFNVVKDTLLTGFNTVGGLLASAAGLPFKGIGAAAGAVGKKHEDKKMEKLERSNIANQAVQTAKDNIDTKVKQENTNMQEYFAGISWKKSLEKKAKKALKDPRVKEGSDLYNAAKTLLDENAGMLERKQAASDFERLYAEMKEKSAEAAKRISGEVVGKIREGKSSVSELLRGAGGRGYATGTNNAKEGDAVVGENGPEIVRFGGGEEVLPNNKAIDVNIISVAKGALHNELEDATVDVNLTGQDGPITTYGTAAKLDENTDNASTIEKALSKKDKLVDYADIKSDNGDDEKINETKKEKSSFFEMLSNIGGGIVDIVKGIVPIGGAIGALYLLFKNPDGVLALLKNIGSGISGIVNFFTGKGKDSNKDAATVGANAITSIADVQADSLWDYANPLADLNHNTQDAAGNDIKNVAMTEAKNEVLYKQALRNQLFGTGTINQSLNSFKSNRALASAQRWENISNFSEDHLGGVGSKWARNRSDKKLDEAAKYDEKANAAQNRNAAASIGRTAAKVGTVYALSNGAGWATEKIAGNLGMSEEGAATLGNIATIATSGGLTVNMIKSAAKGKDSLVDKIVDGAAKMLGWVGKKLAKTKTFQKLGESAIVQAFKGLADKVSDGIRKGFTDKIQKLATMKLADVGVKGSAAIASLGVATVIGGLGGMASGLCGTEHLFGVLPGDADAGMAAISGVLGTIMGALETLPGIGWIVALFDVIDAILIAIPPIKIKLGEWEFSFGGVGIKQTIARLIYKMFGGKENLEEKQQAFQDEKNYYAETYGVEMNDATFNDMVNNSGLGDWLWHGKVKKDENGHLEYDDAGKVLYRGGIKGAFAGAENEYAKDENGNVIKNAQGKAVVAKDAYGNKIKKDAKWGDSVGKFFNGVGRYFAGGDVYETDENGRALVDENGEYIVKDHQKNIFARRWDEAKAGWNATKEWAGNAWNNTKEWASGVKDWAGSKLTDAKQWANDTWDKTKKAGKYALGTAKFALGKADDFIEALPGIGNLYKGVKDAIGAVPDTLNKIGEGIKGAGQWVGNKFKDVVNGAKEIGGNIKDWVSDKASWVKDKVDGVVAGAKDIAGDVGDWIGARVDDVKQGLSDAAGWVSDKLSPVKDAIADAGEWVGEKFNGMVDGLKGIGDWFGDKFDKIGEGLMSAGEWIGDKFNAVVDGAKAAGEWLGDKAKGIAGWFGEKFDVAKDWVGGKLNDAKDWVSDKWEAAKSWGSNLWSAVTSPFQKAKDVLTSTPEDYKAYMENYMAEGGNGGKGGIPFYSQKDPRWANMAYEEGGSGVNKETMADAGCGPAAFAMAASGATGRDINPVESAAVMQNIGARDETGTNWQGIGKAANEYGIDTKMSMKPSESFIDNELDAGKPVVLSGRSGGYGETPYTSQGHYVVATGKDNKGNYIINDPNSKSGPRKYNKSEIVNETGAAWGFGGRGLERNVNLVALNEGGSSNSAKTNSKEKTLEKWLSVIAAVKQAIAEQQPGYCPKEFKQQCNMKITIGGKTIGVRSDCSGFVTACLKIMGLIGENVHLGSSHFMDKNNQHMRKTGFTVADWPGWENLNPGDIIAISGHVEIFAKNEGGKHYVWNCGSTKSCNNPSIQVEGAHTSGYKVIWSPSEVDLSKAVPNCDITASDGSTISFNGSASSSGSSSSGGGFFSKILSFFTELGSRAIEGVTTGKWNTDWSGFFSGNNSGDSDTTYGSSVNNSFGGDVSATAISADESKEKNWKFLTQKMGFTKEAAAGIMGCWQAESSNKPNTIEGYYLKNYPGDSVVLRDNASLNNYTEKVLFPAYANSGISISKNGYKGSDGNYYPGFGLAQWTGPRGQKLFEFAKSKGLDWRTSEGQLAYVESELNGSKAGFRDAIKNVSSVKDATILALDKYEMTEGAHNNPKHWDKRYSYAQGIYNTFKDKDFENGTSSSSRSSASAGGGSRNYQNVNLAAYGGKGNGKKFGGRGLATIDGSIMKSSMMSDIESGVTPSTGTSNTGELASVVKYLNSILNVLTQSNGKLDALSALGNLTTNSEGFTGTLQQNIFAPVSSQSSQTGGKGSKKVVQLEKTNESKFAIASKIASGGL